MSLTTLALRSGNALHRLADRLVRDQLAKQSAAMNDSIDALPCPECRYGAHNPPNQRHAPMCSLINLETARHYARQAEERIDRANKRTTFAWERAHFWEGKFHVIRHENNKLRKALAYEESLLRQLEENYSEVCRKLTASPQAETPPKNHDA